MIEISAYIAASVLGLLALFQIALVAGAPIGKFAWGGAHTVLPTRLRIGSVISIILYSIFSVIILDNAGVIDLINNESLLSASIWILTIYFFIGVLMNGASRSKSERNVMAPTALALAMLCLFIAIN